MATQAGLDWESGRPGDPQDYAAKDLQPKQPTRYMESNIARAFRLNGFMGDPMDYDAEDYLPRERCDHNPPRG